MFDSVYNMRHMPLVAVPGFMLWFPPCSQKVFESICCSQEKLLNVLFFSLNQIADTMHQVISILVMYSGHSMPQRLCPMIFKQKIMS